MTKIRTYSELIRLKTFEERFEYLKLNGSVGEPIFGYDRYLNQQFYTSRLWYRIRDRIIIRDNGCDLGIEGHEINKGIIVHHMNPVKKDDFLCHSPLLINEEYLICVSTTTHNAITLGDPNLLQKAFVERTPNDTCPWKSNQIKRG